jgi:hypothetical protein
MMVDVDLLEMATTEVAFPTDEVFSALCAATQRASSHDVPLSFIKIFCSLRRIVPLK